MEQDDAKESLLWKEIAAKDELDGEKFFRAVKAGDKTAEKVLAGYCNYLAEGLTNLINIFQF